MIIRFVLFYFYFFNICSIHFLLSAFGGLFLVKIRIVLAFCYLLFAPKFSSDNQDCSCFLLSPFCSLVSLACLLSLFYFFNCFVNAAEPKPGVVVCWLSGLINCLK